MIGTSAIGLFIGSYFASRAAQVRTIGTGLLYGLVVWSVFMLLDVIGVNLFGGMSRFVITPGVVTASSGMMRSITMASGWWFFIGYLIGLIAAFLGGAAGMTVERTEHDLQTEPRHP